MVVRTFLKISAVCTLFFGAAMSLIPGWLMGLYGIELDGGGLYLARLLGTSWLGFAAFTWLSTGFADAQLRAAVLPSLCIFFGLGALALLYGPLAGVTNLLGWAIVLVSAVFCAGHAYFFLRPAANKPAPPSVGRA
jgi:hypothetical protein